MSLTTPNKKTPRSKRYTIEKVILGIVLTTIGVYAVGALGIYAWNAAEEAWVAGFRQDLVYQETFLSHVVKKQYPDRHIRSLLQKETLTDHDILHLQGLEISMKRYKPWYRKFARYEYEFWGIDSSAPIVNAKNPKEFIRAFKTAEDPGNDPRFLDIRMSPEDVEYRKTTLKRLRLKPDDLPHLNTVQNQPLKSDVFQTRLKKFNEYFQVKDAAEPEPTETTSLLHPSVGVRSGVADGGSATPVSENVGVEMKDPLRKRKYQRAASDETAEETKGRVEERFRGTGGYGVSRPPRQGPPEMFRGGVSAKTWTIGECRGRARELGWDVFTGGGKHPYKFRYTGENPDLVGRTFTWINGGPNTDVSPDRLKQLMTNCGYYD